MINERPVINETPMIKPSMGESPVETSSVEATAVETTAVETASPMAHRERRTARDRSEQNGCDNELEVEPLHD
jgi:hypothetical protein